MRIKDSSDELILCVSMLRISKSTGVLIFSIQAPNDNMGGGRSLKEGLQEVWDVGFRVKGVR